MSRTKVVTATIAIVISLGLLIPGVTQPILTLSGSIEKSQLAAATISTMFPESGDQQSRQMLLTMSAMLGLDRIEGQLQAYHQTRSIWGTVQELHLSGNSPVAALVMLFSIIVPSVKLLMQLMVLLLPSKMIGRVAQKVVMSISKWSMADVFLMSIIVAYLAGSAKGQMGQLLTMHAQLEVGFYWFFAYCLFSIASTQLLRGVQTDSHDLGQPSRGAKP